MLWSLRMTAAMCVYFCAAVHNAKFSSTRVSDLCAIRGDFNFDWSTEPTKGKVDDAVHSL